MEVVPKACSPTNAIAMEERKEKEIASVKPSPGAPPRPTKKKQSGAVGLVRAALFMARRSSKGKKASSLQAEVVGSGGKSLWRSLVSSMRPLHTHQVGSRPTPPALMPPPSSSSDFEPPPPSPDRSFHDVLLPPPSPRSSVDGMSTYASAEDLRALDVGSDDAEEIEVVQDDGSPNLIDVQAEEFIAKFYEHIRLQRLESVARGNSMIVEHSC